MEPGEYRATCTAVRNPELYRAFARWYLKVDFCIHETGEVVSKYVNLDGGKEPKTSLGPRSDLFKLWVAAMGRRLEKNEPMDLSKIVGMEFMVTVGDKNHGGDEGVGEVYSTVQAVRRFEPEALSSLLNVSTLNSSLAHSLNTSDTQCLNSSDTQYLNSSAAQVPSTAQVQSDVADTLPQDPQAHLLELESRWVKAPQKTEAERLLRSQYRKEFMGYRDSLHKQAA